MACKSAIIRDLGRHYSLECIGSRPIKRSYAPLRPAIQVDNNIQRVKAVRNTSSYIL